MPISTRKCRLALSLFLAAALGAAACSSTPDNTPMNVVQNEFDGAPDWVLRGCSAYWGDDAEAVICGVGSMGGTRNISLARTTAVARGRTEIARTLQTKVKAMLKDYQSTTTGGEEFGQAANDEQHIVDVSKQITQISLSGAEHQDTWISDSGTIYTLVVLDLERFQDSVNKMNQLNDRVREAVVERAGEAFAELDEETEIN